MAFGDESLKLDACKESLTPEKKTPRKSIPAPPILLSHRQSLCCWLLYIVTPSEPPSKFEKRTQLSSRLVLGPHYHDIDVFDNLKMLDVNDFIAERGGNPELIKCVSALEQLSLLLCYHEKRMQLSD